MGLGPRNYDLPTCKAVNSRFVSGVFISFFSRAKFEAQQLTQRAFTTTATPMKNIANLQMDSVGVTSNLALVEYVNTAFTYSS